MRKSVKIANDVLAKEPPVKKPKSKIKWDATPLENKLIFQIAKRALSMDSTLDKTTVMMDVAACHLNGTPLDLKKLLEADDFNFCHDVYGIGRHINRDTGKIERCFLPRCSL